MDEPQVFLVGAGPGHPGLLTLRAAECLARAHVVVYDRLVPPRLLDHAPPEAERVCVGHLTGGHPERYPDIARLLVDRARQGKRVVRLKGGDPFLFGRGGEEAEALRRAGILYEVVPGVTAALGAAAFAGIPLTHRGLSSAVAFVTGHEQPDKGISHLDWPALARFPGTLVIYMGMTRLGEIVEALVRHGKAPATPAAAIRWATTGQQQTVTADLAGLVSAVTLARLRSPSVVIVGPVAALRPGLAWWEQRPLFGRRVLVTRPRDQARDLVTRLEQLGAVCDVLPAVEIHAPPDWAPVDRALSDLPSYDWLVFTSSNGVRFFLRRLLEGGRDLRALGTVRLAAIGPGTAAALRDFHLEADLVPAEYRSEGLAAALKDHVAGKRVLLARADRGRDLLREELSRVAEVRQVAVYSQADAARPDAEVVGRLRRGDIDYVLLTSANIARSLVGLLGEEGRGQVLSGRVRLVTISPVTSEAVRALDLPVAAEATCYTTAGVIDALVGLVEKDAAGGAKLPSARQP